MLQTILGLDCLQHNFLLPYFNYYLEHRGVKYSNLIGQLEGTKISGHYLVPHLSGGGNRFRPERSEGATAGLRDFRYGLKIIFDY